MRLPIALAATAFVTVGCVEEDAAMFIEGVLPLLPEDCEVQANDLVFSSGGVLDLLAGRGYTAHLKVRTNLPATFSNQDVTQSRQQAPNFPNYGAVDNNVVIFETAEVTFSLATDGLTGEILAEALEDVEGAEGLTCGAGVCSTSQPEIIPAGGTAFNVQTQLNRETLVVTELLSSPTAQTLTALYTEARRLADERNIADQGNFLDVPGESQRLSVNVVLVGRTTGSQNLRLVRSAPFPFGIDICVGCLEPDGGFCRQFGDNVQVLPVIDGETCLLGQDFATSFCGCLDANDNLIDFIDRDRTACVPPPAP